MRVAGYTRVSSQEQVEGFSLEAQRAAIMRYCAFKGWEAPVFYEDAGVSGYTDDINQDMTLTRVWTEMEEGLKNFMAARAQAAKSYQAI